MQTRHSGQPAQTAAWGGHRPFTETRPDDEDAPIPVGPAREIKLQGSTPGPCFPV